MDRVRMLSQARNELFSLFEEVTAHSGRRIILRHRGSEHDAVLVSREYLLGLERARADAARSPFSLFGSATANQPIEEALEGLRQDTRQASERKLAAALGGKAGSAARAPRRRASARAKAKSQ